MNSHHIPGTCLRILCRVLNHWRGDRKIIISIINKHREFFVCKSETIDLKVKNKQAQKVQRERAHMLERDQLIHTLRSVSQETNRKS